METHRLVLPEDLNQYGFLFGGRLLQWVDEASWIAASLDFADCRFVTVGMDEVSFRHSVREGIILTIRCNQVRVGATSVSYRVEVCRGKQPASEPIFTTMVSYVNVDEDGVKQPITN
ncbi:acyl-CoA thioesterase [Persicirhabdus sediminis]|uniref:Acyl-CoA thioesterase n=1 Tax=Persicirhabdus sediminis TaxID=454144 RepID=A0A8J7SKJ7_9BACT|nr:acyl-CoA thioesterase [Persicirhabdus sediminis]MBK1789828.1 acyl-CoA thioesterase [Persicirhabdus sediminis]